MLHPQGSLGDLSVHGVVYGVLASLFVALNAIYVKKILPIVDNDSWKLTLYNNLNAFVLFVPLMVTTTTTTLISLHNQLGVCKSYNSTIIIYC